jgi:hypothetical protein
MERIHALRVKTRCNPRLSDLRGHVAGFHAFEEDKKDLRFEISEVRRPGGDLDNRLRRGLLDH